MSPDVKLNTYIDFNKENNEKDTKFKIGDTEGKIMVRHWTCLTNLAQYPIEKRLLLPNVPSMYVENLFAIKP